MTRLFPYTPDNISGNQVDPTFKMYPKFSHHLHGSPPSHHYVSLELLPELPSLSLSIYPFTLSQLVFSQQSRKKSHFKIEVIMLVL